MHDATTYWWLATLAYLYDSLGGSSGGSSAIPVSVRFGGHKTTSNASVTPASYSDETFTPPKLSGSFVPLAHGRSKVNVTLSYSLLGLPLILFASAKLDVVK